MDYELDMEINPDELDVEILDQPKLMLKYTKLLATALEVRDLLKEKAELTRAEIDKDIREDPDAYGLAKITETVVSNAILQEEEYQKVQVKLIKANFEVKVLNGVVSAIEQRKGMLENLVKLHGQQYFAGPSVPHNLSELYEKKQKEMNKRMSKKLTREK